MGVLQAFGRLADVLAGLGDRQRSSLADNLGQVDAVDVLHHQEVSVAGLLGVVGRDDVGMRQPAAACTSRRKRSTACGFPTSFSLMTLSATGRFMTRCSAL